MSEYDPKDEGLTNDAERVWLEAHPGIRRKLDLLDKLVQLILLGYESEELKEQLEKIVEET